MRLADFIGIPWKVRGRDFNGIDCGGLCMLAAYYLYGIEIPDIWEYDETNNLDITIKVLQDLPLLALQVNKPTNGDVISLRLSPGYVHYGLFVDGRMLHISENTRSRLTRKIPNNNNVAYWRFGKGGEHKWV
jgi:cell wall-associated NlpC family hydrolase